MVTTHIIQQKQTETGGEKIVQMQLFLPIWDTHHVHRAMFKIAKGYDHVTKTIRIPVPLAEELETLAAQNDISLNQLINQCIQFALKNQEEAQDTANAACSEMLS